MALMLKTPRAARRGQEILLLLGSVSLILAFPIAARAQQPVDYFHGRAFMTMPEEEL